MIEVKVEPDQTNYEKQDLLYWTFLESVRQISKQNKEMALTLVRTWHAHHLVQQVNV